MEGTMDDTTRNAIKNAARTIAQMWAYKDTSVRLNVDYLALRLEQDHERNGGHVPTESECDLFVNGDNTGCVPQSLSTKYARADKYLDRTINADVYSDG